MLTKVFDAVDAASLGITADNVGSLAALAAFIVLFFLEIHHGYRKNPAATSRRSYLANLGTFLMNDTMMSLMSVSSLLLVAEKFGRWGVLNLIADPFLRGVLSLLLLDLVLYVWHRANHTFDGLWMFHKVHHSDLSMNVTTAFRLHFVEVVFTTVVKAIFVLLTGAGATVMLANEALITVLVMFHHANLQFRGEKWLGRLIVVPSLHRAHHSTVRREHDNNYGFVLSIWDRMFGTFVEKEPEKIGLDPVPGMGVLELVRYGLTRNWVPGLRKAMPTPQLVEKMIAEAAYYRAKARGFEPGHENGDWLEAEREIRSRIHAGKRRHSFLPCCR